MCVGSDEGNGQIRGMRRGDARMRENKEEKEEEMVVVSVVREMEG